MQSTDEKMSSELEFVTFHTGSQSFSLDIMQVREIRRWSAAAPLPHAPDDVLGVMNLRGSVIPVYDLATCFGLNKTPENERNVVVVASNGGKTMGLLVEAVSEIRTVQREKIQEPPEFRPDSPRNAITGIINVEDGMTQVIDLEAVVNSAHIAA